MQKTIDSIALKNALDSAMIKKIADYTTESYWQHWDFWINIFLALVGVIIGWMAYKEAGKAFTEAGKATKAATAAKDAAVKAGKTVKKQSMLLAISETIRMCQIRRNTNYEDTNNKLMDINGKIRNIFGLYKSDLGQNHQSLLQQIETCCNEVSIQFNLLNPAVENEIIYSQIRPLISSLVGHLNELQGVVENELITNN